MDPNNGDNSPMRKVGANPVAAGNAEVSRSWGCGGPRRVVVVGGTEGIGRSIGEHLAGLGRAVAAVGPIDQSDRRDRTEQAVHMVAADLQDIRGLPDAIRSASDRLDQ